jgi:hypothetical protein
LFQFAKVGLGLVNHLINTTKSQAAANASRSGLSDRNETIYARQEAAQMAHTYNFWLNQHPDPVTAGLWASKPQREEWRMVLNMVQGHATAMFMADGCADLLFPEFMKPVGLHLDRALPLPVELSAKLNQIRRSTMVVIPQGEVGLLNVWPDIGRLASRKFRVVFNGTFFTVLGNKRPA